MGGLVRVRRYFTADVVDLGKRAIERADSLGDRLIHPSLHQVKSYGREDQSQNADDPKRILRRFF